jgi:hypothetical protein
MTVSVANVANTNTFDYWRNRTNELAGAMSTNVVTTGSTTTGNAAITGTFTSNVLAGNTIYLSNSTTNVTVSIPNTVQKSTGNYFLNANGNWTTVISPATSGTASLSGTSSQIVDSYPMADFRAVEYTVHLKNTANSYQVSKLLTYNNIGTAFVTEYSMLNSNGVLGVFNAYVNATHVILNCTPTSATTNVGFARINV